MLGEEDVGSDGRVNIMPKEPLVLLSRGPRGQNPYVLYKVSKRQQDPSPPLGHVTLCTSNRDLNLNLLVIGSLVYRESSASDLAATDEGPNVFLANAPVVLSQTAEDGEIKVRISVGSCLFASAIYGFRDPSVLVGAEGYFGRL
uniref:Uncharacterized protein n=1 Tax=Timema genevievae TaxID=629358 RepID=A0A7R9PG39_TIMGE|nr:unnamed protein product [Timema genevievae]